MTKDIRNLAVRLKEIEDLEGEMIRDCKEAMVLGASWHSDMMVMASIKRSLGLADGFRTMVEDQNFTVAAPLVRLQLDCALRLSALSAVGDPEALATAFVKGEKLDKFKTRTGLKLTDRLLVNHMKEDIPWVEGVYNDACEFIHLSSRVLWNSVAKTDDTERIAYFQISALDPVRGGEEKYFSAVEAFKNCFVLTKVIALSVLEHRKEALSRKPVSVDPAGS